MNVHLKWNTPKQHVENLTRKRGLYCVWAVPQANPRGGTGRLLYIGEAENIRERIETHDVRPCWLRKLAQGEAIAYTTAPIPHSTVIRSRGNREYRQIAENCLIATYAPPCNDAGLVYTKTVTVDVWNTGSRMGKLNAHDTCTAVPAPQPGRPTLRPGVPRRIVVQRRQQ